MKNLQIVRKNKKEEMRNYLNEYLIELKEFDDTIKFNKKGEPIYKYFDDYFIDKDRYPIYFIIDNNIAGIALVRELEIGYEIAEFYVLKEYRKEGNSLIFIKMIFDLFDGDFSFSTRLENKIAIKFWDKVSSEYHDVEIKQDDDYKEWRIKR